MKKTGVFVCHCGINIAGTVDDKKVAKELAKHPGVTHSEDYVYMCSDPGQNLIIDAIKEKKLDKVVVACCSPTLQEITFRNTAKAGGLNTFQCEIANIREQCSWLLKDMKKATKKAENITKSNPPWPITSIKAGSEVFEKMPVTKSSFSFRLKFLIIPIFTSNSFFKICPSCPCRSSQIVFKIITRRIFSCK